MSTLDEVGERDGWRCWLCDEPVDPEASVNADRGPSVDGGAVPKGKKAGPGVERLAHRACNTRKGKVTPVVARCPSRADAEQAAAWLVDRLSRFAPDLAVTTRIDAGGGQFLLVLRAA